MSSSQILQAVHYFASVVLSKMLSLNVHVYMKPDFYKEKTCSSHEVGKKNTLFEVLLIATYTYFPLVWQTVDAVPKKNCCCFERD